MAILVNQTTGQGKADECTKGMSCGVACIAKDKDCLKNLSLRSSRIANRFQQMLFKQDREAIKVRDELERKRDAALASGNKKATADAEKLLEAQKKKMKERWQAAVRVTKRLDIEREKVRRLQDEIKENCKDISSKKCQELDAEIKKAGKRFEDMVQGLETVNRVMNNFERSGANEGMQYTQEELDAMRDPVRMKADLDITLASRDAANQYLKDLENAKDDPAKRRAAMEKVDKTMRKVYNDMFLPDEMVRDALEMMTPQMRGYFKGSGSTAKKIAVQKLIHDEDGRVVDQVRQVVKKNDDRAAANLETLMRTGGIDRTSGFFAEPDTMELEHANALSSKFTNIADMYPFTFYKSKKGNRDKGETPLEDHQKSKTYDKKVTAKALSAQNEANEEKNLLATERGKNWANTNSSNDAKQYLEDLHSRGEFGEPQRKNFNLAANSAYKAAVKEAQKKAVQALPRGTSKADKDAAKKKAGDLVPAARTYENIFENPDTAGPTRQEVFDLVRRQVGSTGTEYSKFGKGINGATSASASIDEEDDSGTTFRRNVDNGTVLEDKNGPPDGPRVPQRTPNTQIKTSEYADMLATYAAGTDGVNEIPKKTVSEIHNRAIAAATQIKKDYFEKIENERKALEADGKTKEEAEAAVPWGDIGTATGRYRQELLREITEYNASAPSGEQLFFPWLADQG